MKIHNKKAQGSDTMTWVVATLIIVFIIFIFLFLSDLGGISRVFWASGTVSIPDEGKFFDSAISMTNFLANQKNKNLFSGFASDLSGSGLSFKEKVKDVLHKTSREGEISLLVANTPDFRDEVHVFPLGTRVDVENYVRFYYMDKYIKFKYFLGVKSWSLLPSI